MTASAFRAVYSHGPGGLPVIFSEPIIWARVQRGENGVHPTIESPSSHTIDENDGMGLHARSSKNRWAATHAKADFCFSHFCHLFIGNRRRSAMGRNEFVFVCMVCMCQWVSAQHGSNTATTCAQYIYISDGSDTRFSGGGDDDGGRIERTERKRAEKKEV